LKEGKQTLLFHASPCLLKGIDGMHSIETNLIKWCFTNTPQPKSTKQKFKIYDESKIGFGICHDLVPCKKNYSLTDIDPFLK